MCKSWAMENEWVSWLERSLSRERGKFEREGVWASSMRWDMGEEGR